jgi:WD40 repeat protein
VVDKHGRWLLASGVDGGLRVWRLTAGHLDAPIEVNRIPGMANVTLGFSGTQRLVIADFLAGLSVWNVGQPRSEPHQLAAQSVSEADALALGPHVAAVVTNSRVLVWQHFPDGHPEQVCGGLVSTRTAMPVLGGIRLGVKSPTAVAFDSTGTVLACGMDDGSVSLWDVRAHRLLGPPLRGQFGKVVSLAFEPGTSLLAVATDDNTVALWDTKSRIRALRASDRFGGNVTGAVFRPDGRIVLQKANRALDVVALDGADVSRKGGEAGEFVASADGRKAVLITATGRLAAGDLRPIRLRLGPGLDGEPNASINDRGRVAAIDSYDEPVYTWNANWTHRSALRPPNALFAPGAVAISPDGRSVAAAYLRHGTGGQDVVLWRSGAGLPHRVVLDTTGASAVSKLVFSPDGSLLAGSGGSNGTIVLWRVGGSPTPQVLRGNAGWVRDLAFTADGRLLASGGDDGTVRLWDPEDGAELGEPLDAGAPVTDVVFSPDGDRLLAAHGGLTVWDVTRWRQADAQERSDPLAQLAARWCAVVWPQPAACAGRTWRFPVGG